MHNFDLVVESNSSNYLYVGIVGDSWSDFATAFNKAGGWSLQADGYVYDNGSGANMGAGAKLTSGSRVSVLVDMGAKTVEFKVDGTSIKTCSITASKVCAAACFGGSNQVVRLTEASATAAAAGAGSAGSSNNVVGEASLCTVGKWSTKMAMLGLPVKANSTVQSVTVSLAENGSGFSADWELQVYDRGSGREFTLRSVTPFRVDTGNRGEQTVALAQPAAVAAGQYLAVYCRGADVQLKCTSKESVKYECFYGSAPGVNSSSTLSTWSGRMGWRAALNVGDGEHMFSWLILHLHRFRCF